MHAGGCLATVEADTPWGKQAAATGCMHTHRQSTMDIVDAHQGKSAEQYLTDLHNKCSGGFDMTAPHEIAVASFQELMHAHS